MSGEHLSPSQFGFVEGSHDEWMAAQSKWDPKTSRSGRLNLQRARLHTGQPGIFPERVREYQERPGLKAKTTHSGFGPAYDSPVEIYRHNGELWVGEGHHRIAAAKQSGQKTMRAKFHG